MKCVNSIADDFVVFWNGMIAQQGLSENELCMSMRCVNSMSDDIVVLGSCLFTQQRPSENDLRISMRYVLFDVRWTCLGVGISLAPVER